MKKTDEPLMIPLIPNAVEILNRNKKGSSKNQLVFGIIHNQVVNRNIKVLMERIGINKKISMHCSRHSFASNHVEAGTSILYLKDLLGHKSLMQTQLYAKALQKGLHDSMANLAAMY
ncbi:Tyrosine recombinase XerC [compost metagenome]